MSQFTTLPTLLALTVAGLLTGVGCTAEIDEPVDDDGAQIADESPARTAQKAPPPPKKPPGQTQNPNPGK